MSDRVKRTKVNPMKPVKPISIRFSAEERAYLKRLAEAQEHGKISKVLRRMVRREMQG